MQIKERIYSITRERTVQRRVDRTGPVCLL